MIYWLKKIEWRIRKALGLQKKRVKTIDDVQTFGQELFMKVFMLLMVVLIVHRVGHIIGDLWRWFFPNISRMPTIPV